MARYRTVPYHTEEIVSIQQNINGISCYHLIFQKDHVCHGSLQTMSSMMDDASVSDGCLHEFIYIFSSFVVLFLFFLKCQAYFFIPYGPVLHMYNFERSSHSYDTSTVPVLNRCDIALLYGSDTWTI